MKLNAYHIPREHSFMPTSDVVLTDTEISTVEALTASDKVGKPSFSSYSLNWRDEKLWVSYEKGQSHLPLHEHAFTDELWFNDLPASAPIVCLDPKLGEERLRVWADVYQRANKSAFLRLPSTQDLPHKHNPFSWQVKRAIDWIAAAILLLILSPLMLGLIVLMSFFSPGPIFFTQWRVGQRGKLFRIIKFRTMITGAENLRYQVMGEQPGLYKLKDDPRITPLGRWMRKFSLDELPQLINVLRGEISLVGPRPWALYDAIRIKPEQQKRLNALPGITGAWQVSSRSHLLDLELVSLLDLEYLRTWSLSQDLKILLMTVPKVLSGFGAY